MDQIVAAMAEYSRSPNPQQIADLFHATDFQNQISSEMVLVLPVFLALVMDQDEQSAVRMVEAVVTAPHSETMAVKIEMLAQAINYSHLPSRRRLMERLAGEAAAGSMDDGGADFLALIPTHPVHVDMKWAAFFATANADFVLQICDLLAGWQPESALSSLVEQARHDPVLQHRAMDGLLAAAALAGLTHHAAHRADVRAALYRCAQKQDGLAAALAAKVLAMKTQ